jgi:chloride channel protein, CIC family
VPGGGEDRRVPDAAPVDAGALLRSRAYVKLLVLAGLIGLPVSAIAYGFLELVSWLQDVLYKDAPGWFGFDSMPVWWPVPVLILGGLLTAAAIERLPGGGGHSPADGFHAGGGPLPPVDLPGVAAAALATLSFGAVLGPEAPLIAIGSGLGALAVQLGARGAPDRAKAVIAGAGSFAAIATLIGSPLIGAFLLLEAAGLGGPMLGVILVPGLLAAGVGTLIFLGLDSITGLGTFSLALPGLPPTGAPTLAEFGWALAFGLLAPPLGLAIRALALRVRPWADPRRFVALPLIGVAIGGLAIAYHGMTDRPPTDVLFSGQDALPGLVHGAATWSVGALLAVVAVKSLAYALSLSAFRGGPIFPALFIGAAVGIAASHLPGLDLIPAVGMGIGVMSTVMLNLPLTSVLLAAVLLEADGNEILPLVIVAVVVAYVVSAHLTPAPKPEGAPPETSPPAAAAPRVAA